MFTIKSESEEGVYFLVRAWRDNKAMWVSEEKLTEKMLFATEAGAKRSLTSLLKVMPEYGSDKFSVVEIC